MRASLLICAKLKKNFSHNETEYGVFFSSFFWLTTLSRTLIANVFKILSANLINRSFDVLISCLAIKQKKTKFRYT